MDVYAGVESVTTSSITRADASQRKKEKKGDNPNRYAFFPSNFHPPLDGHNKELIRLLAKFQMSSLLHYI